MLESLVVGTRGLLPLGNWPTLQISMDGLIYRPTLLGPPKHPRKKVVDGISFQRERDDREILEIIEIILMSGRLD